jgi:nucleoside-diphosphate-sugar epimerase
VHTLGRRTPPGAGISHHRADIFDRAAIRDVLDEVRPSHVLHSAWYVEHGAFWEAPENLEWVAATLAFARQCVATGVKRFVGVGSCAEYDWSDGGAHARTEDDPCRPTSPYGVAKLATGQLLEAFLPRAGVAFAWARLFHLYALDEDPRRFVGQMVAALARDEEFVVKAPRLVRDYAPVASIGVMLAALLDSDATGPVNVATGQGRSLAELAHELARALGKPGFVRLAEGGPADRMVADMTKFRAAVGTV